MTKILRLGFLFLLMAGVFNCAADDTNTETGVLTPPAPAAPRINGPSIFGVRPKSPFLYTIPATGERPVQFSADNLPKGLTLNPNNGQIAGILKHRGEYPVVFHARNSKGSADKNFRIVVGDKIALTPAMGWNSWNSFGPAVTAEKVKSAADDMIRSGLADHGWMYVNVDDFWQVNRKSKDPTLQGPMRDKNGKIIPNPRFADMKGLADYIHSKGLKAGLYSSPGPWTCGQCVGSWQHEAQDAESYADWGFDYLKYDWCTYDEVAYGKLPAPSNVPLLTGTNSDRIAAYKYPYALMGKCLRKQKRDIVYSLCQYGMGNVWNWGEEVGGNSWRTTSDIWDRWEVPPKFWQYGVSELAFSQDKCAPHAGPGHWNDPDMLVVGIVGLGGKPHPTPLTHDEQYTHVTMWCMLSAPLLIGCDLDKLDDFTLSLLTNDEVLAVDQCAIGHQAVRVATDGPVDVYMKELEDGSQALAFFNRGSSSHGLGFSKLGYLGFKGKQHVRDMWRQTDLPDIDDLQVKFQMTIPTHGVQLYKLTPAM